MSVWIHVGKNKLSKYSFGRITSYPDDYSCMYYKHINLFIFLISLIKKRKSYSASYFCLSYSLSLTTENTFK